MLIVKSSNWGQFEGQLRREHTFVFGEKLCQFPLNQCACRIVNMTLSALRQLVIVIGSLL